MAIAELLIHHTKEFAANLTKSSADRPEAYSKHVRFIHMYVRFEDVCPNRFLYYLSDRVDTREAHTSDSACVKTAFV